MDKELSSIVQPALSEVSVSAYNEKEGADILSMQSTKRELALLEGIVQILIKTLDPEKIILFGSRSKGTAAHGSDFDIAVDQSRPSFAQEKIIEEKVDEIAGLYKVDIIYLQNVDEDFRRIVYQTGKVVYERS